MSSKLCQVIAVATAKKTETKNDLTKIYQGLQKNDLLSGFSRTYRPKRDGDEKLPGENKYVQVNVNDVLKIAANTMSDLFDLIATQDVGNTIAKANVVVDNNILAKDVPVTTLLFLEKQLTDIHTVVSTLPVLDPSLNWRFDDNRGYYVSDPVESIRTKKIATPVVLYDATPEHPAQTQMITEDESVGYWTKVEFSGAISKKDRDAMIIRVRKVRDAVVRAREAANQTTVENVDIGGNVLKYIFGDL